MDHSATTPVRSEVVDAMEPFWMEHYGNPSSIHKAGRKGNVALTQARQQIAALINAKPSEIIFTASGTESDNMGLRGIALARRAQNGANRIVTSAIEHHAVLHTAEDLAANFGFELSILPVGNDGLVDLGHLKSTIQQESAVAVVSIMTANNEIGTIQPISEISELCRSRSIPFHTDAVQAAGKLPLNVNTLGVDALSMSAHKFYGPKGVGLLYLRRGTPMQPILTGGSHEHGYRAGTENIPLIIGMAAALSLAEEERSAETERLSLLRDHIIAQILENVPACQLTGSWQKRLPHLASFVISGVEAEGLLIGLDLAGIAASSGSACTSGAQRPSHVLAALGVQPVDAAGGLRLSLGRDTTADDVTFVVAKVTEIVQQLRSFSPPPL